MTRGDVVSGVDEPTDPRECGWMGCGHPRCVDSCAGVPLDEWRTWKTQATTTDGESDD